MHPVSHLKCQGFAERWMSLSMMECTWQEIKIPGSKSLSQKIKHNTNSISYHMISVRKVSWRPIRYISSVLIILDVSAPLCRKMCKLCLLLSQQLLTRITFTKSSSTSAYILASCTCSGFYHNYKSVKGTTSTYPFWLHIKANKEREKEKSILEENKPKTMTKDKNCDQISKLHIIFGENIIGENAEGKSSVLISHNNYFHVFLL